MALTSEEGRMLGAFKKHARDACNGKIGYSRRAVYRALVDCIHWPDRTAYKSRATICAETGYCEKTVKQALSDLRIGGWLEAVAYEKGGRGRTTVYKFPMAEKGGDNCTALRGAKAEKGGKKFPKKGGNNQPPYNSSSKYKKASASRGQVDKAPVEGTADEWKVRRLHELCERMGYGEAKAQLDREYAGE